MSGIQRLAVSAILLLPAAPATAQEVAVRVDPRVELLSILFRAAGRAEYRQGRIARWNAGMDSLLAAHASHDALRVSRGLAREHGVGFFAPISLAIHLDAEPLALGAQRASAPSLHRTWRQHPDSTAAFVATVARFRQDARFDSALEAQAPVIRAAESRLRAVVAGIETAWFARFWGDNSLGRLTIVPGLTAATASYGLDVLWPDGRREGYAIIGVTKVDDEGLPRFDSTDVTIVVHELNHPYVTAVLRGASAALRAVGDSLYRGHAAAMQRIGYGSGDAVLNETLVRAAVIRYLAANRSAHAAAQELEAQEGAGFVWLADVVALLQEYETQRSRYLAFDDFAPVLTARLRASRAR